VAVHGPARLITREQRSRGRAARPAPLGRILRTGFFDPIEKTTTLEWTIQMMEHLVDHGREMVAELTFSNANCSDDKMVQPGCWMLYIITIERILA